MSDTGYSDLRDGCYVCPRDWKNGGARPALVPRGEHIVCSKCGGGYADATPENIAHLAKPRTVDTLTAISPAALREAFDAATARGQGFNEALMAVAMVAMQPGKRSDGAPDAIHAYLSDLAANAAVTCQERHDYLPYDLNSARTFRAHQWVRDAMYAAVAFDRRMNGRG